ncbi:MAG: ASKHA domain-containing protein, partial [Chloroflexi bacterium]|nr:ASKHA domain-containing protein [Chloroflexota bacterium]
MTTYTVHFQPGDIAVTVPGGSTLSAAARLAGFDLNQPCGGQGRCGRCAVIVNAPPLDTKGVEGDEGVRRLSTMRLTNEDVAVGYALACQTVVEGDAWITVPPQQAIERRLTTHKAAARVEVPFDYDARRHQPIQRYHLRLDPPDLADQTDDWARVLRALAPLDVARPQVSLNVLRTLPSVLRGEDSRGDPSRSPTDGQEGQAPPYGDLRQGHAPTIINDAWDMGPAPWEVTAVISLDTWDRPDGPPQLLAILPGDQADRNFGAAVDIGTTTVTVWLVDLESGEVVAQAADYNGQIARGEDVISRIIYAKAEERLAEMQRLVIGTINRLLEAACKQVGARPDEIFKLAIAGNTTMIHLLLALPPESIRLTPYIPVVNQVPALTAGELGLLAHPQAIVDCLPGIASYVGADISAGVLSTKMDEAAELTLFIDVGTNGETVLGNADWLVTCACSAGPAFEGAGVEHGMRATVGAIEEVWINADTLEPSYRVIGREGEKPKGICGSGLLSLLAEMFVTGVVDKAGNLKVGASPRLREGEHGPEY